MARRLAIIFAVLLAAVVVRPATAQEKPKKSAVTPAQETAAREFAQEHHPELAEILERLESSDRPSYEKAVRDIAATSERMSKLREADAERYELAVHNWTLDSRVRLLTARLTMSDDPELRGRLKELLHERQDGRLALLKLDRQRTTAKLEKLEAQIEELERDGDAAVDRDLARIERNVQASARVRKPAGDKKPVANKKPKPDPKKPGTPEKPRQQKPNDGG